MKLTWQTEKRRVRDLLPAEYNPRQMTEDQARELRKSLEKFDLVEIPAIDQNGTILAGHMRVATLIDLGRGDEAIDVRVPNRKLTDEEAMEYNLRSNKNTGEWDMDKLFAMPEDLLKEVGFSNKDIQKLVDGHTETKEDDYDTDKGLLMPVRCEKGDIWQLGSHRLMCGDSTAKEDVERLMDGKKADMVFTDPPYNLASHSRNHAAQGESTKKTYVRLRNSEWDKEFDLRPALENIHLFLKEDCVVYVCTSHFLIQTIWDWANQFFKYNNYIVWCKPNPTPSLSKRHWTFATELIVYAVRGKHTCNFPTRQNFLNHYGYTDDIAQQIDFFPEMNYWRLNKETHTENHPTQKPIKLISKPLIFSSNKNDIILDLFGGSGSTLIACEQTERVCYMMEIDPKYCTVILDRWEKHTGQKAAKIV